MIKHTSAIIIVLVLLFSSIQPFAAQEATETPMEATDCPAVVQTAISLTSLRCETTDSNQVCYGHIVLDARSRQGLSPFEFAEPGDIVDVVQVQSLRLSAMDTETGQWGVVMMQIEATLAATDITSDDQDVQILLFGDAVLEDANQFLTATAVDNLNIRSQPNSESAILGSLVRGEQITVNGRLEGDAWLRVRTATSESNGWIFSELVELNGDLTSLNQISAENAITTPPDSIAQYGPMQAFYFQSGMQDAPCPEAPNSGVLIQTPEGVASVNIWMDEVVIQMDGTAYLQGQANGNLVINMLEGQAQVESQNDTRTVVEGMQISVPLDADSRASNVPSDPQPYTPDVVQSLPISLLDDPVTISPPRSLDQRMPLSGDWFFEWGEESLTCPDETVVPFESIGTPGALTLGNERLNWGGRQYNLQTPGIYTASYADANGNLHQDTLQVIAADRIEGEKVLDLADRICTLNVSFRLQLQSASGG